MTSLDIQEAGRICAVAGQSQRDLRRWMSRFADLFPTGPFDAGALSTVAMVHAFASPRLSAAGQRTVNRATIWAFAVDRLVDEVAQTETQVRQLVRQCRAVAAGEPARDPAGAALAALRDELAEFPAYPRLEPLWQREVGRMLGSMAREWRWRRSGTRPTVDDYLGNADNLAFCFIFASHLVSLAGTAVTAAEVNRLMNAARATQRVVRVINDLGTYRRDVATGDLNVLGLGVTRPAARRLLAALIDECHRLIGRIGDAHPDLTGYLGHQVDFNLGFYPVSDYWGRRVARVAAA